MIGLPLIAIGVVIALGVIAGLIRGDLGHAHMHFVADRAASGASPEAMGKELRLRMAAARLRRRTTEAVKRTPSKQAEIIRRLAKEEALRLAAFDKVMARQFLRWAEDAELGEILYPAAMAAVFRQARKRRPIHHETHRDMHAALRVTG